jgi:hypothetical protein
MHGPNFTRPAPELINGEEEYSIEKILDSRRFGRRWRLQYLVKWEGYPDVDNMWVDKDDIFAEDKVREFKASNPEAETHIRSSAVAKSPYPPSPTRAHLLYQHALSCMCNASLSIRLTWTCEVWMQPWMTQLWSSDTRYSNTRSPLYVRRRNSTSTSIDK